MSSEKKEIRWAFRIQGSMSETQRRNYIEQGRLYKNDTYHFYFNGDVNKVQEPTEPLDGLEGEWISYGYPPENLVKVEQ